MARQAWLHRDRRARRRTPGRRLGGEELIAIDQIEQRHGLAAQGMDDVTVVDDMAMFAIGGADRVARRRWASSPGNIRADRHKGAPAADGRSVAREPSRTPCAGGEGAGAGESNVDLLVVGGLADRQLVQRHSLLIDALGVAEVAAANDVVDEAPPCGEIVKVSRGAQQQSVGERSLEWPWALSIEPFSWLTPGLLRVGVMP